ncbi:MAG: cadherin-like domain-containing protein, partial [Candidatus Eisenbacteria sp.]|nr:cadherin-like domain-containing protein [Candidatus Eisenbacteria bacterium]
WDFDSAGNPGGPGYWYSMNTVYPTQSSWNDFVPGDGYAYITVDHTSNNGDFQGMGFGVVPQGHRLEVRMKGALVTGFTGFIFTYMYPGDHEIDIELVPDDKAVAPDHDPHEWSDARFNTCLGPDWDSNFQPIVDAGGTWVSHYEDDTFHTYTIDWFFDRVVFYIDGVYQHTIDSWIMPYFDSEVIIGFRDLSWAGSPDWTGTRTMTVDWLNVQPIDDNTPVAAHDQYSVFEGSTLDVAVVQGVLANDTGSGLSTILVSDVAHGVLSLNSDGSFSYDPDPGFTGHDHFVYFADDGTTNGKSNAAVADIQVNDAGGNHAPAAVDDSYSTGVDQLLTVAAPGVLGNDSDQDEDVLSASLVSDVSDGVLSLAADGSFTYDPASGFEGTDSFTYAAHDGLVSDTASVFVTVSEGLAAHWRFDEGSGGTAYDSAGGNDGTLHGPTWVSGQIGHGLSFDGLDDYVEIGASDLDWSWTAAMWVNRSADRSASALMGSSAGALKLEQWPDTHQVGITAYADADYSFAYSTPIGEWVHLAFVCDGTKTLLYVNGAPSDSVTAAIAMPLGRIGNGVAYADPPAASLDEVRVYSRALGGSEVYALWEGATGVADASDDLAVSGHPRLLQNYPNPFNPTTVFSYVLRDECAVRLSVYTADGRRVATLVDEVQSPGSKSVTWEATDRPSGVYFYRLTVAGETLTGQAVLLK